VSLGQDIHETLLKIPIVGQTGEGYMEIAEALHKGTVENPGITLPAKDPRSQAEKAIAKAAEKYKVNPTYLWGIYGTETAFGTDVKTSSAGAKGPFQFEPETAKEYGYPLGVNENGITNWTAFQQQANAAARFLAAHGATPSGGASSEAAVRAYNPGSSTYLGEVLMHAKSWGLAQAGEAKSDQEREAEKNTPVPSPSSLLSSLSPWGKFGELGLSLILMIAGAVLLVYGVMVMLRPREKALSPPRLTSIPWI